MREILFRGKRLDNGEWVSSGNFIRFDPEEGKELVFIPAMHERCVCAHDDNDNITAFETGMFYKVDLDTVGQYTGLKDKKGRKIFEGDIIKENDVIHNGELQYEGLFFAVVYANGCWFAIRNNRVGERKAMFLGGCCDVSEVIGNIHDNPELLEGENTNG